MPRLRYTATARSSLAEIRRFIALRSKEMNIALSYIKHLKGRCHELASYDHEMGRDRPELGYNLRSVAEGNYIIFFRYVDGWLEVVNILEGHQDIDASYFDDLA